VMLVAELTEELAVELEEELAVELAIHPLR
jgi:hypothetical protein